MATTTIDALAKAAASLQRAMTDCMNSLRFFLRRNCQPTGPAFAVLHVDDICTTCRPRRVTMDDRRLVGRPACGLTRRMVASFIHDVQCQRVVFAPGAVARGADEAARLGLSGALVRCALGRGARPGA